MRYSYYSGNMRGEMTANLRRMNLIKRMSHKEVKQKVRFDFHFLLSGFIFTKLC